MLRRWCSVLVLAFAGGPAMASSSLEIERVKTGILPEGGFYSVYEVACSADETSRIARLRDTGRWCVNAAGELDCFRRSAEASQAACELPSVAAREGTTVR